MYTLQTIGESMKNNVKVARIKASMKQEQLATKTGVTRQIISLIEKGEVFTSALRLQ